MVRRERQLVKAAAPKEDVDEHHLVVRGTAMILAGTGFPITADTFEDRPITRFPGSGGIAVHPQLPWFQTRGAARCVSL